MITFLSFWKLKIFLCTSWSLFHRAYFPFDSDLIFRSGKNLLICTEHLVRNNSITLIWTYQLPIIEINPHCPLNVVQLRRHLPQYGDYFREQITDVAENWYNNWIELNLNWKYFILVSWYNIHSLRGFLQFVVTFTRKRRNVTCFKCPLLSSNQGTSVNVSPWWDKEVTFAHLSFVHITGICSF